MTGTHKGKLGPVPASGRKVQVPGISIISLCEGRIVRDRVRADMVGLLAQIGAIASLDLIRPPASSCRGPAGGCQACRSLA